MQKISKRGLELLKQFEGVSLCPYLCPAGKRTIGYGHVVLPSEEYLLNGLSSNEADALLKRDVLAIESALSNLITVTLAQAQLDALICLAYNIGLQAFENSTLLRLLNQGKVPEAGKQFSRWVYSKGKPLNGLIKRRAVELKLFTEESLS
jgi:lysozyme